MEILSHRGYWKTVEEKNQEIAFKRSFSLNYGTETDVRDFNGKLVISHDIPMGGEMSLTDFLPLVENKKFSLAMNIKADGLSWLIHEEFKKYNLNWFVFDMSIPDMRQHLNVGNPVFARMSEVEKNPAWETEIKGIWLDGFKEIWYNKETIEQIINKGLKVCIVSPELHKREYIDVWKMLKHFKDNEKVMLCTDIPEDATNFFELN